MTVMRMIPPWVLTQPLNPVAITRTEPEEQLLLTGIRDETRGNVKRVGAGALPMPGRKTKGARVK